MPNPTRILNVAQIRALPCPNLLPDLMAAGRLLGRGRLEVPIADADRILATCPDPGLRGLGDLVAKVAQPIARAIDKVAGTNLKDCAGCAKRRNALNAILPFQKP